jgi:hypothetical protein
MDAMTRTTLLAVLVLGLGCATPVRTETLPAAEGRTVQRIAVAPPRLDLFAAAETPLDSETVRTAGQVVTSRLMDSLERSGRYEIISPAEVETALRGAGIASGPQTPEGVGQVVRESFGSDSVLFVRVRRFVSRQGGKRGALRGASVWFELTLRAPDGTLLWRGAYDETQQGLTEDLLSFRRAVGRRFRWVNTEELAAYGAEELVARMPGAR